MLRIAALIGLLAAPAAADDVATVSGCVMDKQDWYSPVFCDVQNLSPVAIAEIATSIKVTEKGRSVPWVAEGSDSKPLIAEVPGGIEPGETRRLWIWQVSVPQDADWDNLRVEVTPIRFIDVNGSEISPN